MSCAGFASPLGPLTVWEEGGAITKLDWTDQGGAPKSDLMREAIAQLAAYFDGTREVFELPFHVKGTQFQKDVCAEMSAIPFGYTRTYGEIAKALGAPAQAVGQACGANPIPIMIPCHRVMGAKGLTGFSGKGGVETKVALLRLEGAGGFLI
ncbi:MAG: methylated-DNA--[protein]-cysteine S-methyltransferase [Pseudomonadota bacterium]